MIQLCHDREDLRCVETILRLRGAEDLLEGTLISIDAWVSENRARLP
jgi:hypothetical protein